MPASLVSTAEVPQKADESLQRRRLLALPIPDSCAAANAIPIRSPRRRAGEQRFRDRKAERLGGLQIDKKIEPGWLLHGQVTRFRATQYLVYIRCAPHVTQ
jgi:hypothetical protein